MTESSAIDKEVSYFMNRFVRRNGHEREFQQAVREAVRHLMPVALSRKAYREERILDRITEPDRVIQFRVVWEDDHGRLHVRRAWRVQFNNAIGPYKGGMRFRRDLSVSVLKFLGFEQTLKNSLTGLPLGGAKGGSNFDPRGKSDREVMRFCQKLMVELSRYIGEDTDIPAGDIGVGPREISYMYGQYRKLTNRHAAVLTGKGLSFGGSPVRREAAGYGTALFMQHILEHVGNGVAGKTAVISGSGNVALYAAEMLLEMGAKVVTMSDSDGFIHDPDGLDEEKWEFLRSLKEERRGRVREYAERYEAATYHEGKKPWGVPADLALPCASQNELDEHDAKQLVDNGVRAIAEGANMPCTGGAAEILLDGGVIFGPGKAANAGGVAVSALEQTQNLTRSPWTRDQVETRLRTIMEHVHQQCVEHGSSKDGRIDYRKGADVAGFLKVAEAMLAYGVD